MEELDLRRCTLRLSSLLSAPLTVLKRFKVCLQTLGLLLPLTDTLLLRVALSFAGLIVVIRVRITVVLVSARRKFKGAAYARQNQ